MEPKTDAPVRSVQSPSPGRIVLYRLNDYDRVVLKEAGADNPNNGADEAPAMIVRVFSDTCINLRVFVDGREPLWVTSKTPGDDEGQWRWPPFVPARIG